MTYTIKRKKYEFEKAYEYRQSYFLEIDRYNLTIKRADAQYTHVRAYGIEKPFCVNGRMMVIKFWEN